MAPSISNLALFLLCYLPLLFITYHVLITLYNITLHPLRRFPGPVSHAASLYPRIKQLLAGRLPQHVTELHRRYGPVVRIAPNELSFVDPAAWKSIYARPAGGSELAQDPAFYGRGHGGASPPSIISANRHDHEMLRRLMSPGFSERAMRGQEPAIQRRVNLLMSRLRQKSEEGSRVVNVTDWIAYTTFDVLGALAFGEDFGCLEGGKYHPWVKTIIEATRNMAVMSSLMYLKLDGLLKWLMNFSGTAFKARELHQKLTEQKVRKRIDGKGPEEGDFLGGLIDAKLPFETLKANAALLVIAGSETTATLLTGAVFFLTTHPEVLAKLSHEVRSKFSTEEEITLTSVNGLSYMLACLNETLRCYPPVPIAAYRVTPKGGATIAGHRVAANTTVGVCQWAINHEPTLFHDPYGFHPERYEGKETQFASDRLDAVNPFIIGPRNCLGQNLAYAEMRLILAKLIWNFDMRIAEESRSWLQNQKVYLLWAKPPLNVFLSPAAH